MFPLPEGSTTLRCNTDSSASLFKWHFSPTTLYVLPVSVDIMTGNMAQWWHLLPLVSNRPWDWMRRLWVQLSEINTDQAQILASTFSQILIQWNFFTTVFSNYKERGTVVVSHFPSSTAAPFGFPLLASSWSSTCADAIKTLHSSFLCNLKNSQTLKVFGNSYTGPRWPLQQQPSS